jgi:type IV pilus assembly protein PilN
MIRINLLPIKQDRRREAARNQLIVGAAVLLIEVAIFVAMYMSIDAEVNIQENINSNIKAEVTRIKAQIKDHKTILSEIADYEKRQAAIDDLQKARTGPVHIMLELSSIISKGGRPNIDEVKYQETIRIDPTAGYDEDWDYRRIWISDFTEKNRKITLKGQALTHEDVAEFLRRINLSRFFVSSELISTNLGSVSLNMPKANLGNADAVVHFTVRGEVRYQ